MYAHLNNEIFKNKIKDKKIDILKSGEYVFFTGLDANLITHKLKAFRINHLYYAYSKTDIELFLKNKKIPFLNKMKLILDTKENDSQSFDLFLSNPFSLHSFFYECYKEDRNLFLLNIESFKDIFFFHLSGTITDYSVRIISHYFDLILKNKNFEDFNLFEDSLIYFKQHLYKHFKDNLKDLLLNKEYYHIEYFEKKGINFRIQNDFFTYSNLVLIVEDNIKQRIINIFLDRVNLTENFLKKEFDTDKIQFLMKNESFYFFIQKYKSFFGEFVFYPLLLKSNFYDYSMDKNLILIQDNIIENININYYNMKDLFTYIRDFNKYSDTILYVLLKVDNTTFKSNVEKVLIKRKFDNF